MKNCSGLRIFCFSSAIPFYLLKSHGVIAQKAGAITLYQARQVQTRELHEEKDEEIGAKEHHQSGSSSVPTNVKERNHHLWVLRCELGNRSDDHQSVSGHTFLTSHGTITWKLKKATYCSPLHHQSRIYDCCPGGQRHSLDSLPPSAVLSTRWPTPHTRQQPSKYITHLQQLPPQLFQTHRSPPSHLPMNKSSQVRSNMTTD